MSSMLNRLVAIVTDIFTVHRTKPLSTTPIGNEQQIAAKTVDTIQKAEPHEQLKPTVTSKMLADSKSQSTPLVNHTPVQTVHDLVQPAQSIADLDGICKDIVTRNPFLNYMRYYRQHTTLRRCSDVARVAAKSWHTLSDIDRMPFVLQAMREQRKLSRHMRKRLNTGMTPLKTSESRKGNGRLRRNVRRNGLLKWPDVN